MIFSHSVLVAVLPIVVKLPARQALVDFNVVGQMDDYEYFLAINGKLDVIGLTAVSYRSEGFVAQYMADWQFAL